MPTERPHVAHERKTVPIRSSPSSPGSGALRSKRRPQKSQNRDTNRPVTRSSTPERCPRGGGSARVGRKSARRKAGCRGRGPENARWEPCVQRNESSKIWAMHPRRCGFERTAEAKAGTIRAGFRDLQDRYLQRRYRYLAPIADRATQHVVSRLPNGVPAGVSCRGLRSAALAGPGVDLLGA